MRPVLQRLSLLGLAICLLPLLLTITGCDGCGSQSNSNTQPAPSPPPSNEPQSLTLADLKSGDLYQLRGMDTSATMKLRLMNRTNRIWLLHIEEGTKVEPAEGSVQSMVVTHEIHVTVHPHEEPEVEVQVACLDINKDAPATGNVSWSASLSPNLSLFIGCANSVIDDMKTDDPEHADDYEKERRGIFQHSLWKARGASSEDFIRFYMHYQQMTEDEARQATEDSEPLLERVVNKCSSVR